MVSIFIRQDLTQEFDFLVTVDSIAVPVLVRLTEVSLVQAAVTETRVVVLCGFLVGTGILEVRVPPSPPVVATVLVAFVVSGVQSGLTKLVRATRVAVTIPDAPAASLVAGVVAVRVSVAIITNASALDITAGVVSIFECFAKVTAVDFAVAET